MCNHRLVLVLSLWIGQNTRRRLESENKRGAYKCICISERIHPFVDGNGRTGRLLLNLWLISHGYLPTLLEPEDRPRYYAALRSAD
ncbi:MAG: Fic family protein [Ferrimicrobium sp.]